MLGKVLIREYEEVLWKKIFGGSIINLLMLGNIYWLFVVINKYGNIY